MSKDLKAYFDGDTDDIREVLVSKRLLNPDPNVKEPENWIVKRISRSESKRIKKACTSSTIVRGQKVEVLDSEQYSSELCVACLVYPDICEASWQNKYGGETPAETLDNMLSEGEFTRLVNTVNIVNGFDRSLEEELFNVKN